MRSGLSDTDRAIDFHPVPLAVSWAHDGDVPDLNRHSRRLLTVALAVLVGWISLNVKPPTLRPAVTSGEPSATTIVPMEGTVSGAALVFASYNVCKVTCAPPAPAWVDRRDRVVRTIVEAGVDVVGLQEVTHQPTTHAKTQFLDVQQLTAPYGFASPAYTAESDTCRWRAEDPHPCTHTTGLLFNRRTIRQADTPNGTPSAGTLPASAIANGLTADAAPRKVTWAYLSGINGSGPFLAISLHTSTLKDQANEESRITLGRELGRWVDRMNAEHGMTGVPAVLMGDLNSYRRRQPSGIQQVLVDEGWTDAAQAPTRRNVQYSTINYNPLLDVGEQGFPRSPYVFRTSSRRPELDATRIDYVMVWGSGFTVLDYEVVIRLQADGSFDPTFQGSDHQMVRATLDRRSAG